MPPVHLTGMTWNHTRGYVPMVATAQRFEELHPDVSITWHRRSLQAFADASLDQLARDYDLIVVDHPWAGHLAHHDHVIALDDHLPTNVLDDQAANSVGQSFASYRSREHQWALAIDAATPVSSWRPDLLDRHGATVPQTWDELLTLARRGLVALPSIPLDSLMHVYMCCIALGEPPFATPEAVVSRTTGVHALEMLRELVSLCPPACLKRNPIRTYEAMTTGDAIGYCPFAYGYVNYTRRDYTDRPLRFGGLVSYGGRPLRSILGGTGLVISQRCAHLPEALAYAQFVAGAECQSGLYVLTGGQPGHRCAWTNPAINLLTQGFFSDTLSTLDDAFLRPTYDGYIPFQDNAGPVVHSYLVDGGNASIVIETINALYGESQGLRREH